MMFEGLVRLAPWAYAGIALLSTHITVLAVTIFLHRNQAHRSLSLHPAVSHFFRFWLWLTTSIVTKEWVAVHRKHHARCETPEDPHSPQVLGLPKVLFGGVGLYRKAAADASTVEDYGKGTPDDWLERNVYARHRNLGLGVMLASDVLLFGWVGLIIFAVQMLWIPFWAAGVINGVGHYWGYRNFETGDASRNIVPVGLFAGGEELHNNHHAYKHSARFSNKWWELDVGWLYIRLFQAVGLARVKRTAPATAFLPAKDIIDIETVKAVLRNRYHVLKLYGALVVRPVVKTEFAGDLARRQIRRLKKWMTREDLDLDEKQRQSLALALKDSTALQTIFEFKQQLKALLQPSVKEVTRLAELQAWCANAEAAGIEALQDFARQLRGYSMRAA